MQSKERDPASQLTTAGCFAIEVSAGEFFDKVSILEIKAARFSDPVKLRNVRVELDYLRGLSARIVKPSAPLTALLAKLRDVNERIWVAEDEIRVCQRAGDYGPRWIEHTRTAHSANEERAAIKRQINVLLSSRLIEEKAYGSDQ